MGSPRRALLYLGALLLTGLICADAAIAKKKKVEMPAGWDDATINLIKEGKSTEKVLAVLEFQGNELLTEKAQVSMSEMLATALAQTNRFVLVERERLDKVIAEQNLALAGLVDESAAAEVGNMLGAQYVVMGAVTSATRDKTDKFGYIQIDVKVGVDVQAVNTSTGKLLVSEKALGISTHKEIYTADGVLVSGALDDASAYGAAARDAVEKVAEKIVALAPVVGFVVDVSKKTMILDVGSEKGVATGDRFVVFRVGDEIKHPATGNHLGWKKEIIQEIEITETERAMSTGKTKTKGKKKDAIVGDYVVSTR